VYAHIVVMAAAITISVPSCSGQPVGDYWGRALYGNVPAGPFGSWSKVDQEQIPKQKMLTCSFSMGERLENYHPHDEDVLKHVIQYLVAACVYHGLPSDWPGHNRFGELALQHYEAAKLFDPSLPDPEVSP
jgi:hypothetical protein